MGRKRPERYRSVRRRVRFQGLSRRAHIVRRRLGSERRFGLSQLSVTDQQRGNRKIVAHTLQKSRCAVWYEFNQHFTAPIYDQAVKW